MSSMPDPTVPPTPPVPLDALLAREDLGLRRIAGPEGPGIVVHWANTSSAAVELNGGTVYGAPFWDEARVSADNPVERLPSYANKRVFFVCGLDEDVNETPVRAGQREFHGLLTNAGMPHEIHELPGGHFVRREMLQADIDGAIARLRTA